VGPPPPRPQPPGAQTRRPTADTDDAAQGAAPSRPRKKRPRRRPTAAAGGEATAPCARGATGGTEASSGRVQRGAEREREPPGGRGRQRGRARHGQRGERGGALLHRRRHRSVDRRRRWGQACGHHGGVRPVRPQSGSTRARWSAVRAEQQTARGAGRRSARCRRGARPGGRATRGSAGSSGRAAAYGPAHDQESPERRRDPGEAGAAACDPRRRGAAAGLQAVRGPEHRGNLAGGRRATAVPSGLRGRGGKSGRGGEVGQ